MKAYKIFFLILVLLVSTLFLLHAWQGYRYNRLEREVRDLEAEQKEWLEQNKKLIAGLAVFSSPARIEKLAKERLGLIRVDPSRVIKAWITGSPRNGIKAPRDGRKASRQ